MQCVQLGGQKRDRELDASGKSERILVAPSDHVGEISACEPRDGTRGFLLGITRRTRVAKKLDQKL